jgi:hypothetical protein
MARRGGDQIKAENYFDKHFTLDFIFASLSRQMSERIAKL